MSALYNRNKPTLGFTLAELLIALAILGVIATFAIPKIIAGQQSAKRIAIFKERIATLSGLSAKAALDGSITDIISEQAYFRQNLNYIKLCDVHVINQGCSGVNNAADGYLLANGASISSINGFVPRETVQIDWNGPDGPNTLGDDVLLLWACMGDNCASSTKPGQLTPLDTTATTLYNSIFE